MPTNGDRDQIPTVPITIHDILASKDFAQGFNEARRGLPFDPDNSTWEYERGRCFGGIAPVGMPLRIGGRLNPKALKLAEAAFARKLLV